MGHSSRSTGEIASLKEKYRPVGWVGPHGSQPGDYCVLGIAATLLEDEHDPFPSLEEGTSILMKFNPKLKDFQARVFARKILSASDKDDQGTAWKALDTAINWAPQ